MFGSEKSLNVIENCVFGRVEVERTSIFFIAIFVVFMVCRLLKQRSSCSLNHYVERSALSRITDVVFFKTLM